MSALIIFSCVLILLLMVYYYHLVRQYYVEQSIYALRQSKHDILLYIAENAIKCPDKELSDLRGLLKLVNDTISLFSKINRMHFSSVKIIINNTINSSTKIDGERAAFYKKHEAILTHYIEAIQLSLKAIPLLKVRLVVYFVKVFFKFLILLGVERGRKYLNKLELFLSAENSNFNGHCLG